MTDSSVRKIIARAGDQAQLGFPVHPHMLRHACGYKLANDGHDTRAIPWPSEYPAHCAIHGDLAGSVQRVLAGLVARLQNAVISIGSSPAYRRAEVFRLDVPIR